MLLLKSLSHVCFLTKAYKLPQDPTAIAYVEFE
jgi:hypothetical protein